MECVLTGKLNKVIKYALEKLTLCTIFIYTNLVDWSTYEKKVHISKGDVCHGCY